ncbi:MAG: tetratricopeptide repeat-containing protein, partial [Actinomycetota bacterium]
MSSGTSPISSDAVDRGPGGLLEAVDDALRDGEPLLAHDLARQALADGSEDLRLEHRLVLALARSGAVHRAESELARRDLVGRVAEAEPVLQEDVLALRARLAKDRALAATGSDRRRLAADASARYEEAARPGGTAYPLVNAAVLALVAGDEVAARRLADEALLVEPQDGGYWALASRAEAAAVLGEHEQVEQALDGARALDAPVAWRAATRRQFRLLADATDGGADLVDLLPVPAVIHYTGHRLRYEPGSVDRLRARIDEVLDSLGVGVGHGS